MGYRSEVFAAVAGSKTALEALIQFIKPFSSEAEQEIFSYFKLVKTEENSWLFAFYDTSIKWYKESENVWYAIRNCARDFGFSYVFYRLGDDIEDTEADEYCADKTKEFYHRLINSVSFNRSIILDERVQSAFENQQ